MKLNFYFAALSLMFLGCNSPKEKKEESPTKIIEYKDLPPVIKDNSKTSTTESFEFPGNNGEYQIGQGFNSATYEVKGDVAEFNHITDKLITVDSALGQRAKFDMKRITSYDDLSKFMGLDISTSIKLGIFKASGRVEMLESYSYNRFSDFLAVRVTVRNPSKVLNKNSEKLTAEALQRASEGQDEFIDYAGDEFINGIITGGEAIAVYEFLSTTEQNRTSLRTHIDASVKAFFFSAQASSDYQKAMNELKKFSSKTISFYRQGDTSSIPNNPEAIVDYMARFPSIIAEKTKASILFYLTKPIKYIKGLPSENRNFTAVDNQSDVIRKSAKFLSKLYQIKGDLKYVDENLKQFEAANDDVVKSKQSSIDSLIESTEDCIKKCAKSHIACRECQGLKIDENSFSFKRKDFIDNTTSTLPPEIKVFTWDNAPEKYGERIVVDTIEAGQTVDLYYSGLPAYNNSGNGRVEPNGNCISQEVSGEIAIEFRAALDNNILLQRDTFYMPKNSKFTSRQRTVIYLYTKTTKGIKLYNCDGANNAIRIKYW